MRCYTHVRGGARARQQGGEELPQRAPAQSLFAGAGGRGAPRLTSGGLTLMQVPSLGHGASGSDPAPADLPRMQPAELQDADVLGGAPPAGLSLGDPQETRARGARGKPDGAVGETQIRGET